MTTDTIDKKINSKLAFIIRAEFCDEPRKKIPMLPNTHLFCDLGIHPIMFIDIIMNVEDRFDIDIPHECHKDITTFRKLTTLIKSHFVKGG